MTAARFETREGRIDILIGIVKSENWQGLDLYAFYL